MGLFLLFVFKYLPVTEFLVVFKFFLFVF